MLSAQGLLPGAALAFSGGGRENAGLCRWLQPVLRSAEGHTLQVARPVLLISLLLPPEYEIERLRYFTARVSGKLDPRAPARQRVYLRALATLAEVEIHYGRFLAKTAWRPLSNLLVTGRRIETPEPVTLPEGNHRVLGGRPRMLPVGAYPDRRGQGARRTPRIAVPDTVIAEFHTMEEKGSDVNLATHLLNDAWNDLFEAAAVISNDTDLVVPIRMVAEERNKPVFTVCPGRWQIAPQLRRAGEPCPPHPPRHAEGGAVSGHAAGHRNSQTGGPVSITSRGSHGTEARAVSRRRNVRLSSIWPVASS